MLKNTLKTSLTNKENKTLLIVDQDSKGNKREKDLEEMKIKGIDNTCVNDSLRFNLNSWSGVVFLDELHILLKWNTTTVVSIYLIEIPLNHLFCYRNVQRFEGVLHQSSELFHINQLIFISFLCYFFCLLSTLSEKVRKLNKHGCTY